MKLTYLMRGMATFVPGAVRLFHRGTGGTCSARYCYAVWLRHLVLAAELGLLDRPPRRVVEIGPGDSLGSGIAALLSGAEQYHALDAARFATAERNLMILEELVDLFRSHAPIPTSNELSEIKPNPPGYGFPTSLLTAEAIDGNLAAERLERIRSSIRSPDRDGSMIRYTVPGLTPGAVPAASADMILSQSALEYVEDLAHAFDLMSLWLAPAGFMSHQIDLKSIGHHDAWNGHWTYSDLEWAVIKGRRRYVINRQPVSAYLAVIGGAGLKVAHSLATTLPSAIDRRALARRFAGLSDEDLTTGNLFVQAVRH